MLEEIHHLNEIIKEMKNTITEMKRNADADINELTNELMKKDAQLEKMKKAMENVKDENSTLRTELKGLEKQFLAKEQ